MPPSQIIDVHHHFLPRDYLEKVGTASNTTASGRLPDWDLAHTLEMMESVGIGGALLSISSPGVGIGPGSVRMARLMNEIAARMRDDDPSRFGFLATLPMTEPQDCLAEIEYAFDVLGADGAAIFTNYAGNYLGSDTYTPIMQELNRRQAVVLLHPASPPAGSQVKGLSEALIEFPAETTRTVMSMLQSGVAHAFPTIRFILPHAGGVLPYLVQRLTLLSQRDPAFKTRGENEFLSAIRRFYFDMAVSTNAATASALFAVVPKSQVLFGSDWPFVGLPSLSGVRQELRSLALSEDEVAAIEYNNALMLFPRFRTPGY